MQELKGFLYWKKHICSRNGLLVFLTELHEPIAKLQSKLYYITHALVSRSFLMISDPYQTSCLNESS